jgi:hypothetical protein
MITVDNEKEVIRIANDSKFDPGTKHMDTEFTKQKGYRQ